MFVRRWCMGEHSWCHKPVSSWTPAIDWGFSPLTILQQTFYDNSLCKVDKKRGLTSYPLQLMLGEEDLCLKQACWQNHWANQNYLLCLMDASFCKIGKLVLLSCKNAVWPPGDFLRFAVARTWCGGRRLLSQAGLRQTNYRTPTCSQITHTHTRITFALRMLLPEVDVQEERGFCPKQVCSQNPWADARTLYFLNSLLHFSSLLAIFSLERPIFG